MAVGHGFIFKWHKFQWNSCRLFFSSSINHFCLIVVASPICKYKFWLCIIIALVSLRISLTYLCKLYFFSSSSFNSKWTMMNFFRWLLKMPINQSDRWSVAADSPIDARLCTRHSDIHKCDTIYRIENRTEVVIRWLLSLSTRRRHRRHRHRRRHRRQNVI